MVARQPAPQRLPLVVALGDPAGIGAEITLKAWAEREKNGLPVFYAIGSRVALEAAAALCALDVPITEIAHAREAQQHYATALPLLPLPHHTPHEFGKPSAAGARVAWDALEQGVAACLQGHARALVTAPVSKQSLYQIGFDYAGQTEFLAARCGVAAEDTVMMLAGGELRVVPLTIHIPLKAVPHTLTQALIMRRARVTAHALKAQFGIENPRLAFAGLNPHAGEQGALGREELEVILPALQQLRAEGIEVLGPIAGDALFQPRTRRTYDVALCMYHDQALIPLKALHVDEGVNISLGLPVLRTSPDHGTGFDIAPMGIADAGAMIAAINTADRLSALKP